MRALPMVMLLVLTGCQKEQTPFERSVARDAIENPIGRYKMKDGADPASVVVLDTRAGKLSSCVNVQGRYRCLPQWDEDEFKAFEAAHH